MSHKHATSTFAEHRITEEYRPLRAQRRGVAQRKRLQVRVTTSGDSNSQPFRGTRDGGRQEKSSQVTHRRDRIIRDGPRLDGVRRRTIDQRERVVKTIIDPSCRRGRRGRRRQD
ncbi:hypothetical protein B0H17DRAFT_1103810 [Mycena rosella]|uniref:Uncharacterized protein n=1 Tax=Mycena rosella TaxID=1033263 RepID=A0AAD7FVL5_MYCRO|nr:hypothetical protein B0H17DRAFT_1103810 [Mycena rosella]